MIKLNSRGRVAQFYRYHYYHDPSRNLCPFFWQMLLAVIVFPITWTSFPWNARNYGDGKVASFLGRFFVSVLCTIVLGFAGLVLGLIILDPSGSWEAFKVIGMLIAGVAGIIGAVVGSIGLYYWLQGRLAEVEVVQETKAIIKGRKESFMERYCPKIEWR